jgi:hypothetical protein
MTNAQTHPHPSDVKITTPEEAMEYLKQSGEAPPVRISEIGEPSGWFEETGPYGSDGLTHSTSGDRYMEYTIRWSSPPLGKYDWAGFYMMEDYVIHPDLPWPSGVPRDSPVHTRPDGTKYVTLPGAFPIFWQWATPWVSSDSYYMQKIGLPGIVSDDLPHGVVPLPKDRHDPYVRYYFWDYNSGQYIYSGQKGVPAGA